MTIVLRSASVEALQDVRTFEPEDLTDVRVQVRFQIGPRKGNGSDTFTITVATPAGLTRPGGSDSVVCSRPILVVREYNGALLWEWINDIISKSSADTCDASVQKLIVYFDWEYQDYRER